MTPTFTRHMDHVDEHITAAHVNELQAAIEDLAAVPAGSLVVGGSGGARTEVAAGRFYADAFGAVGDGITDDTAAFRATQTAAGPSGVVRLSAGKRYLITDDIPVGTACTWEGPRSERGANGAGITGDDYNSARIIFRPADTTKWLISRHETGASPEVIGPFIFKNLAFDFGDANGLRFGKEDLNGDGVPDPVEAEGQRYVFGVQLHNCSLQATIPNHVSSASGVLTRSGRTMLALCKTFDSLLDNLSFYGGDTQLRVFGSDAPTLTNMRMMLGLLPLDLEGSGNYRVQYKLSDIQIEGFALTPIRMKEAMVGGDLLRIEQVWAGVGLGRLALTPTAAVTAGSATLTFSSTMANILFPGLSIIELTDGTNTDTCLVTAVNGVTVTVESRGFAFDWTAGAATVTRIHGYGPLKVGDADVSLSNVSIAVSDLAPHFVMAGSTGQYEIIAATRRTGAVGGPSLAIGNKFSGVADMGECMRFVGCSPLVLPDLGHPLVRVIGWRENHGQLAYEATKRGFPGDLAAERAQIRRAWVYTAKSGFDVLGLMHTRLFKRVAGNADTAQQIWAWKLAAADAAQFVDETLPSVATGSLRIRMRARAVSGSGGIFLNATGAGAAVNLITGAATTAWTTHEVVVPVPACWTTAGGRVAATATSVMAFSYDVGLYVAAIEIEEVTPTDPGWLTATAALNFGSIAAQTCADLTITVAGAAVGDAVDLGPPAALETGLSATGLVTAANTVTIRLCNVTAAPIDPASATWRASVEKR